MARYGCSRMTVNKAMASLAATGLITRNRRAGTSVARPKTHGGVLTIPDIRADTEARGARYGYQAILDELRPPCCVHLGSEGHHLGQSRFVRSVHLADASPVLIEDRHVFLDAVPNAALADFRTEPPGPWPLGHVPWTEAEHRIAAVAADALTAVTARSPAATSAAIIAKMSGSISSFSFIAVAPGAGRRSRPAARGRGQARPG